MFNPCKSRKKPIKNPEITVSQGFRLKTKSKMEDKVGLTLACLNLKKLVKMRVGKPFYFVQMTIILSKDGILA